MCPLLLPWRQTRSISRPMNTATYNGSSMRRWTCAIFLLCGLTAACAGDRPRPEPTEPEGVASLFAAVRAPANNATVFGARPLDIQIYGLDVRGFRLTGVGYVVRRNAVKLDSVAIHFSSRADSLHTFT